MKAALQTCVVCGVRYLPWEGTLACPHYLPHVCRVAVINAIESANTRAEEPCPFADPMRRGVAERIDAGARILWRDEAAPAPRRGNDA